MIHKIEAMVLFVQDLAGCTAFYRDTFKLQYKGSDADSASFLLEDGLYLILLSPSGAADLLGTEVNELKIEGGPRGLLAAFFDHHGKVSQTPEILQVACA